MIALLKWLLIKHSASIVIPTAMGASILLTAVVQDWNSRLIIMIGVGSIAGIILAIARLRIATATAHKIDADTTSSQWVLIVENLHAIIKSCQEQTKALSNRLEQAQLKEDVITFSKHEAVKHNQAMIFFIQNVREIIGLYNQKHPHAEITLPTFEFVPLTAILRAEDEARLKFAQGGIQLA